MNFLRNFTEPILREKNMKFSSILIYVKQCWRFHRNFIYEREFWMIQSFACIKTYIWSIWYEHFKEFHWANFEKKNMKFSSILIYVKQCWRCHRNFISEREFWMIQSFACIKTHIWSIWYEHFKEFHWANFEKKILKVFFHRKWNERMLTISS